MISQLADSGGSRISLRRTGAWCLSHKANRLPRMRRSKSSAGFTGDPFLAFCGDRVFGPEEAQISPKVFLRYCWNAETCGRPQRKGAIAFLYAHGAEALSDRRTAPCNGDQTWQRPEAHSVGRTACRGTTDMEPADTAHCRAHLRASLGYDIAGSRAQSVKG